MVMPQTRFRRFLNDYSLSIKSMGALFDYPSLATRLRVVKIVLLYIGSSFTLVQRDSHAKPHSPHSQYCFFTFSLVL